MKAIRAKCLDCMCGSSHEVTLCPSKDCPLFDYRSGHNPFTKKREYTEEQKDRLREQMMVNLAKKDG